MFVKGWQVPSVEVPPPNKRYLKVPMSPEVTGTHNATLLYSIISPGYTTSSPVEERALSETRNRLWNRT
jgi:hypothetical protein